MPKAFLIKKKHEAMIAAQLTGVKRPWLDEMELPEDLSRSSCSPAPSVSPAPSDCSVSVPDMTMPFDLSMKRPRVESPEPATTPVVGPAPEWPRVLMPPTVQYAMPHFYYPLLPQMPFATQMSGQPPLVHHPLPLGMPLPAAHAPPVQQHDIAVVPSWSQADAYTDKESSAKTSTPSSPVSPSASSTTSSSSSTTHTRDVDATSDERLGQWVRRRSEEVQMTAMNRRKRALHSYDASMCSSE
ncbi:zinc finger protein-like [Tropilaelaps mercedesae]|uniref:Zinc finger protein-like n=1 Tax=Tropilaelaps mercedesae TaxID=418985 RepID=A0A1V9XG36_9ACAR|nr:zinc finger protein-like [Tropilaelaps mercedesae]